MTSSESFPTAGPQCGLVEPNMEAAGIEPARRSPRATWLIVAAVASALLLAQAAQAAPPPAADRALHQAANRYRIPYLEMRAVAWCESRWNPRAVGRGVLGLFQFQPATFAHTPYRRYSIFSPWANAMAAAWQVKHDGGWDAWTCRP